MEMKTAEEIRVGTSVEAIRPGDPLFKKIRGTVTGFKNGYYQVEASEVVSKWSDHWEDHPSSCVLEVKKSCITDIR